MRGFFSRLGLPAVVFCLAVAPVFSGSTLAQDSPKPTAQPTTTPTDAPTTAPTTAPTAAVLAPEYMKDENGRSFRVRFDSGNRFWISSGWQGSYDLAGDESVGNHLMLGLGFQLRDDCSSSDMDCWKVGHEILSVTMRAGDETPSGWPALTARLVGGRYIKYMRRPSLTLPTRPPITFSIPFHMGMEFFAGTATLPEATDVPGMTLEVFQGNLLLEFWRHPTQKRALLFGVGVSYSLDLRDQPTSTAVEHRLCPFTALKGQFHFETEDGMTWLDMTGRYLPTWSDQGGWYTEVQARMRLEQVVLALNDMPVRLYVEGDYQHRMFPFRFGGLQDELRVMAGLSWSVE